jgi:hypothetical protein
MRYTQLTGFFAIILVLLFAAPLFALSGTREAGSICTALGAWRWVEESLNWLKSVGMDRSRLVQIWLLFMLIGLIIIMRIKPRA